jgi:hypothetical protein
LREAAGNLGPVEYLVRDPGALRRVDRAADEIRLAVVGGGTLTGGHDQGAAGIQQGLARLRFQLAPDPMRGGDEGDVVAPLADGLARDPGLTMARPERMRRRETVETDHRGTAFGQLVKGGTAHGPEAQNRDIDPPRHRRCPRASAQRWNAVFSGGRGSAVEPGIRGRSQARRGSAHKNDAPWLLRLTAADGFFHA